MENNTATIASLSSTAAPDSPRAAPTAAFDAAVVGLFVALGDALGAPKSLASIYGIIFASPHPLTFAEVEERLQLSKGSVSQGLKVLREIGAIRVVAAEAKPEGGKADSGQLKAEIPADEDSEAQMSAVSFPLSAVSPPRPAAALHRYAPDMELRKLVLRFVQEKLEPQLADVGARLSEINGSIPYTDRAEADELRQRLAKIRTWHKKAKGLMPVAKTFLNLG